MWVWKRMGVILAFQICFANELLTRLEFRRKVRAKVGALRI